ncbi:MAG: ChbG/HpnK family deacetylase, partial [Deltaproteobacteria bacterium]
MPRHWVTSLATRSLTPRNSLNSCDVDGARGTWREGGVRQLAVTADDFGVSGRVNAAVVRAAQEGILTGTSWMAGGAAADEALARARDVPQPGPAARRLTYQPRSAARRAASPDRALSRGGPHAAPPRRAPRLSRPSRGVPDRRGAGARVPRPRRADPARPPRPCTRVRPPPRAAKARRGRDLRDPLPARRPDRTRPRSARRGPRLRSPPNGRRRRTIRPQRDPRPCRRRQRTILPSGGVRRRERERPRARCA